jgi:hypothetical protein
MAATRTARTPEKGERLLAKLAQGYSVTAACKAEKIGRQTYYDWRNGDDAFAKAADAAIEQGTDVLEDAARSRALYQSDTLLIFLLKARRRDKYGDKQEVSGPGGAPLTVVFAQREDGPA